VPGVKYRFAATEAFYALPAPHKESARAAWLIFKEDPFDPRLRTHKIHRLSALMRQTVFALVIEGDLRAVFYIEGGTVISFNIGSHAVYRQ
jgi:hypothetical protein